MENDRLQTVAITVPQTDMAFLKKLSGKMGWKMTSTRTRTKQSAESEVDAERVAKNCTLQAIADMKQGKDITRCATFDEYLKAVAQ